MAGFERQVLRRALERAQFKQTVAAKILGLSYHQFRSLLRKHGLAKQTPDNGD
ncbi:Psp operon transcriptional activator [compost metagenome]